MTEIASRSKPGSKNLVGLSVSLSLVGLAPLVGMAATALLLRRAFGQTATVDPAEKARFLAEGISSSMNGMACGLIVSCVAAIAAVTFAVRLYRERTRAPRA